MEEVDVAIVGAGAAGLAAAVALHQVQPKLRIKVLESRPAPANKYGGFVKLQPNGLKAAAAISPALATALRKVGLKEKRTLLHGEDGRLVTRLDTREDLEPAPSSHWSAEPWMLAPAGVQSPRRTVIEDDDVTDELEEEERLQRRALASPGKKANGKKGHAAVDGGSIPAARRLLNVDESSPNIIVGWYELERLLISMLPPHTVEYEASFLKYHETEGGVVALFEGLAYPLRARVLLGCDGPFSGVRAQCVQDSEPAYDRTVKWVGRLDGHHVSTTPLDYSAWWLKKGQVFVSHPLANGDVGWEALVSDRELQAAGYEFDESLGRVLAVNQEKEIKEKGNVAEIPPSQALAEIFKGWPKSVDQMVRYSPPDAVLEGGVYIRSASDMPPSMGKGRVAILGEAAHPLRPTGQDTNMALEDAAELAAYVQEFGVSKEALRRYDVARRPRWRHVMQLTAAQGASTTTGIALTHGFIDYTKDLYQREFTPLGRNAFGRAHHGPTTKLGRLARALQRTLIAGVVVSGVLLLSSFALPRVKGEPDVAVEVEGKEGEAPAQATARKVAWRTGRHMQRGAYRLGDTARQLGTHVSRIHNLREAKEEVHHATEYVGSKAEDVTGVAIDSAGGLVKRTLKHRLAEALGAF